MDAPPFDIHIGYRRGDREIAACWRDVSRRAACQCSTRRVSADTAPLRRKRRQARMIVLLISSEANDGRELRQFGGG
jgi:hypothetical protein